MISKTENFEEIKTEKIILVAKQFIGQLKIKQDDLLDKLNLDLKLLNNNEENVLKSDSFNVISKGDKINDLIWSQDIIERLSNLISNCENDLSNEYRKN